MEHIAFQVSSVQVRQASECDCHLLFLYNGWPVHWLLGKSHVYAMLVVSCRDSSAPLLHKSVCSAFVLNVSARTLVIVTLLPVIPMVTHPTDHHHASPKVCIEFPWPIKSTFILASRVVGTRMALYLQWPA